MNCERRKNGPLSYIGDAQRLLTQTSVKANAWTRLYASMSLKGLQTCFWEMSQTYTASRSKQAKAKQSKQKKCLQRFHENSSHSHCVQQVLRSMVRRAYKPLVVSGARHVPRPIFIFRDWHDLEAQAARVLDCMGTCVKHQA